jgi:sporulation protein YlmC with PRC-barrel domain
MMAAPTESWTVTNYYKQAVYDPRNSKVSDIDDVLLDKSGKVTGLVLGVDGFLGAGEKDVIVPFTAVKTTRKNDKWWLTLDETKDDLKSAPGFKYDTASTTWVPDKK